MTTCTTARTNFTSALTLSVRTGVNAITTCISLMENAEVTKIFKSLVSG